MPTLPYWKLRRLAPRVLRVLARLASISPALAAYLLNLKPAAEAFISLNDLLEVLESRRIHEMAQGKTAVRKLLRHALPWVAQIAASKSIPGLQLSSFGDSPDVPDDVIKDVERIVALVNEHKDKTDVAAWAQSMLDDVTPALAEAKTRWQEAEQLKAEHATAVAQNQENAQLFSDLLVGFRRSLATVIGRNHPDYQTLRSSRIDRQALDEAEEEDLPPSLVPAEPSESESSGQVVDG